MTSKTNAVDFLVRRENLGECRSAPANIGPETELATGQLLLEVDAFAFTANNITYAVVGDMMGYWNFFPAPDGWGRIPVWGFANVVRSKHDEVSEGERVWGYFPMSTYLLVQADRVKPGSFTDVTAHRQALPPIYNDYSRTAADPQYDAGTEDRQMLLRPLFATAFLLDDFLDDNDFFGVESIVLSSASSKTSFALASLLSCRSEGRPQVVGLTSPGNIAFVKGLGCYDEVLTYDQVSSLDGSRPVVSVDMAGNTDVLEALHTHFGERMKHSAQVGLTHWEKTDSGRKLPGVAPTFFFAPAQIQKRLADWGGDEVTRRLAEAWHAFLTASEGWLSIQHGHGPDAVEAVYRATHEGRAKPNEGHILSLRPGA